MALGFFFLARPSGLPSFRGPSVFFYPTTLSRTSVLQRIPPGAVPPRTTPTTFVRKSGPNPVKRPWSMRQPQCRRSFCYHPPMLFLLKIAGHSGHCAFVCAPIPPDPCPRQAGSSKGSSLARPYRCTELTRPDQYFLLFEQPPPLNSLLFHPL